MIFRLRRKDTGYNSFKIESLRYLLKGQLFQTISRSKYRFELKQKGNGQI